MILGIFLPPAHRELVKVVNITQAMTKLQYKLPQALISRGFTQRTVFHALDFQQKGINRLMDIYQIWKHRLLLQVRRPHLASRPFVPSIVALFGVPISLLSLIVFREIFHNSTVTSFVYRNIIANYLKTSELRATYMLRPKRPSRRSYSAIFNFAYLISINLQTRCIHG